MMPQNTRYRENEKKKTDNINKSNVYKNIVRRFRGKGYALKKLLIVKTETIFFISSFKQYTYVGKILE